MALCLVTPAAAEERGVVGPDVLAWDLFDTSNWGTSDTRRAYSVGTDSCNRGDLPVDWESSTAKHPVIAQNLYRLKDERFEQVGMSWLKHGFSSLNQDLCGGNCVYPGTSSQLGVGCSDPYWASLNGSQSRLGPRSEVNPFTGVFPASYPYPSGPSNLAGRLIVDTVDVDPAQNAGALYFVEGHYVAADDAQAGNGLNNASYRRVTVDGSQNLVVQDATVEGLPAVYAWADNQPNVTITTADVPGEGRFTVGHTVIDNLDGTWRYVYAIHNLNSHRAAQSFTVPVAAGTTVTEVGFHDVDYHSGEPYALTDWSPTVGATSVTWSTDTFATDPNANALRWGTMYTFWFTADRPGETAPANLALFLDGSPGSLQVQVVSPADGSGLIFADGFEDGTTDAWVP